jgi:hypothetical protein
MHSEPQTVSAAIYQGTRNALLTELAAGFLFLVIVAVYDMGWL